MPALLDANRLEEFIRPVSADLDLFDQKLNDYLRGDSPLITSVARHLLKTKGKRIRPTFLFLSSRANESFSEFSVDASLAIELIHTATLLHDDVVDEADLRRGQETVNAKWTNLISVLMGDYLFAKAFRIMVDTGSVELIRAISMATERVSVGELRQIEETGNYALSEEEYLTIIADKTASLFNVSCEVGPILSRRSSKERQRFAEFGEKIGTAFQIADDLLDIVGDPQLTGKERGNDLLGGKVTLPLIHALGQVSSSSQKEMTAFIKGNPGPAGFEKVFGFIRDQGGIEYAYARAEEMSRQGLETIKPLKDSVYAEALVEMVQFTTARAS